MDNVFLSSGDTGFAGEVDDSLDREDNFLEEEDGGDWDWLGKSSELVTSLFSDKLLHA